MKALNTLRFIKKSKQNQAIRNEISVQENDEKDAI